MGDSNTTEKTSEGKASKGKNKEKSKKKPSFFKGLKKEFKKVIWPDKSETAKETTAVLVISIVTGIIIAVMDIVIQSGVNWLTTF